MNIDTIKMVVESLTNDGDEGSSIEFLTNEDSNMVTMVVDGKTYHIHKDNIIRLGNIAKPLTYKEALPSANYFPSPSIKYY